MSTAENFAGRLRGRQRLLGYWIVCDNPVGTERIARAGYDYVCVDGQHGLLDYAGWLAAMTAIDAGGRAAGIVRVPANDPTWIGRALDVGARAVIVPLVNSAEEAAAAVGACRYPPHGVRSFGPMRSALRVGPDPAEANEQVACVVMIETADGLANVEEICAVDGLDGLYVGPSDLTLALGGSTPGDLAVAAPLADALKTIVAAAEAAGIACGMHCGDGATAVQRLDAGFTFATVSSDLGDLELAAAAHLRQALGDPG
ncbi:HpcH/HpaI aldolase family protein [Actinomadura sp. HBU206391]|uniref:HpcH/HpaI aldolase family protein n=1 Tax=Actinomadura sp. HBU206391 TaxID=2731692 RepID=UPI00164F9F12|nr:aldolase/citrate lyase family protein [Actinomadura sp. HBU206391]MBC6456806.1 aldolase [Actinomadura sp. HBU206391]